MFTDTICAIATPPGEGGIGIIRISGPDSLRILKKIFHPVKKKQTADKQSKFKKEELRPEGGVSSRRGKFIQISPFIPAQSSGYLRLRRTKQFPDKKLIYGYVYDNNTNKKTDEALAVYMKAPHTYTGEDVVEIQAHGGTVSLRKILDLALSSGAKLAQAGEFTKRAFLNGRIDLSQAEAVADLIKAKTQHSLNTALSQLQGKLSEVIKDLRKKILDYLALMEAHIDFCEEDLPPVDIKKLRQNLNSYIKTIEKLIQQAEEGRILRQGALTAIIGRPNVGKSTLLNKLLQQERAIVTPIPGTTRDTLEEWINLKETPFKLIDTAGLRQTYDEIEILGVDRTKTVAEQADLILLIIDASEDLTTEDKEIIKFLKEKKCLVVLNKIDLKEKQIPVEIRKQLKEFNGIIKTSLTTGQGVEQLKDMMVKQVSGDGAKPTEDYIISNIRHKIVLEKTKEHLEKTIASLDANLPIDFFTIDLKAALETLGEITGETITEDIVNQIFSEFCIGK